MKKLLKKKKILKAGCFYIIEERRGKYYIEVKTTINYYTLPTRSRVKIFEFLWPGDLVNANRSTWIESNFKKRHKCYIFKVDKKTFDEELEFDLREFKNGYLFYSTKPIKRKHMWDEEFPF